MKVSVILCLSLLRFSVHAGIYVYSSREGCVSVNSAESCPVTWNVSTDAFLRYKFRSFAALKSSDSIIALLNVSNPSELCKESIKKTFCSQVAPRCLDDGRRLDYGDVNSTCQKIYDSCPKIFADSLYKQNFCGDFITGEHPRFKCVEPSKPIKGGCPQPKFKMPSDYLSLYRRGSTGLNSLLENFRGLKNSNGTRLFSDACLGSEIKKLACPTIYCTTNEELLLTKYNRDECFDRIKGCFSNVSYPAEEDKAITALKTSYEELCKTYPVPSTSAASSHLPQFLLLIVSLFLKVFI